MDTTTTTTDSLPLYTILAAARAARADGDDLRGILEAAADPQAAARAAYYLLRGGLAADKVVEVLGGETSEIGGQRGWARAAVTVDGEETEISTPAEIRDLAQWAEREAHDAAEEDAALVDLDDSDESVYCEATVTVAWATPDAWGVEIAVEGAVAHPPAPPCADGETDTHMWASPHALVGGCGENPGVWGHGAGIRVDSVCLRCAATRAVSTASQGRDLPYDHGEISYDEGDASEVGEYLAGQVADGDIAAVLGDDMEIVEDLAFIELSRGLRDWTSWYLTRRWWAEAELEHEPIDAPGVYPDGEAVAGGAEETGIYVVQVQADDHDDDPYHGTWWVTWQGDSTEIVHGPFATERDANGHAKAMGVVMAAEEEYGHIA